jgi:cytochrome c oxidase subunit 2
MSGSIGRRPVARVVALASSAAWLLVSCSSTGGAPDQVTEQGRNFTQTWRVFLFGAVAVTALIWLLVLVAAIRFRRRGDRMPDQRQYNIPLEVLYTVVPVIIVAALFTLTVVTQRGFTDLESDPDLTVEVTGFQWQWRFDYVDQGVTVNGTDAAMPPLVLPVGRTVRIELRADDVIHSFWVPEFLEKRDLIPGVDNAIDVKITKPGRWRGRCAEYCGLDHWKMTFDVYAVPAAEYDAWIAQTRSLPQPVLAPLELPPSATEASS